MPSTYRNFATHFQINEHMEDLAMARAMEHVSDSVWYEARERLEVPVRNQIDDIWWQVKEQAWEDAEREGLWSRYSRRGASG